MCVAKKKKKKKKKNRIKNKKIKHTHTKREIPDKIHPAHPQAEFG